jgi:L-alanine-DL-glutamate epimerase-like enolase superfamily enzyme
MSAAPADAIGFGLPPVRIARVGFRALRVPAGDGLAMSFAQLQHRSAALVIVETEDGLAGVGESWVNHPPWALAERQETIREGLAPLLIGQDARDPRAIHERLLRHLLPVARQWGAPGPIWQAISGVDIALWDLLGQALGQPAHVLLGGARIRERVPVYASSLGPDTVGEQAAACKDAGFSTVKLRVGFSRGKDLANLRAAREALGDEAALFVDANQAWDLDEAVAMAPVLHRYGVTVVEEPISGDQLELLEQFHRRTGLLVATGENVYGARALLPYLRSPAVAIAQPDVSKTGGLTEAFEVCRLAAGTGTAVWPHMYGGAIGFAATLQLAACAPGVEQVEYDVRANPLRDPLLTDPPAPHSGVIGLPSGPGLGVTFAAPLGALPAAVCEPADAGAGGDRAGEAATQQTAGTPGQQNGDAAGERAGRREGQ